MYWEGRYEEASLSDAPFFVQSGTDTGGKNLVVDEFPGRRHHVEEMGPGIDEYAIEAFFIGEDYKEQLNAFRAVLKSPGPWLLIHPLHGVVNVFLQGKYDVSYSVEQLDYCSLKCTFIDAGDPIYFDIPVDTVAAVNATADAANVAVQQKAIADLEAANTNSPHGNISLGDFNNTLRSLNGELGAFLEPVNDFQRDVINFTEQAETLLKTPSSFVNSLAGLGTTLTGSVNKLSNVLNVYKGSKKSSNAFPGDRAALPALFVLDGAVQKQTSDQKERLKKQAIAINSTIASSLLIGTAKSLAAFTETANIGSQRTGGFESYQQAQSLLNNVLLGLDDLLNENPDLVDEISSLRAALISHVNLKNMRLKYLTEIILEEVEPAVVLAHRIYKDITRLDEIVARNNIKNPLFLPAGVSIEVLSE